VYTLAQQLLSPQRHYDWGLRAMKTVLQHAGQLIHSEKKRLSSSSAAAAGVDYDTEVQLLVGALRVNTLSKLTYADSIRFNALINDVFPVSLESYFMIGICITREIIACVRLCQGSASGAN